MKNIKMSEILKDAGFDKNEAHDNIYRHTVKQNDESYLVITKNAKVSLAISATPREEGKRFRLIKAIYEKAVKFDGNIIIQKGSHNVLVSVNGINSLVIQ